MVMRHKEPDKTHPIWKDWGPPDLRARASPYRSSSNANFLIREGDNYPKFVKDKSKIYKKNSVIITDTVTEFLQDRKREA